MSPAWQRQQARTIAGEPMWDLSWTKWHGISFFFFFTHHATSTNTIYRILETDGAKFFFAAYSFTQSPPTLSIVLIHVTSTDTIYRILETYSAVKKQKKVRYFIHNKYANNVFNV
jgi:hypothetical protein